MQTDSDPPMVKDLNTGSAGAVNSAPTGKSAIPAGIWRKDIIPVGIVTALDAITLHDTDGLYRHFGQHIPRCLQHVLEKKLETISKAVGEEVGKREKTPDEFYDYLNTVMPKTGI